jgi:hypothetical protein
MALTGHVFKEIKRKVRVCIIEEGKSPGECVQELEKDYELTKADKIEIGEMAKSIGKK